MKSKEQLFRHTTAHFANQFQCHGNRFVFHGHSGGDILTDGSGVLTAEGRLGYGAAVDLGTTTVALKLFDLKKEKE